MHLRSSAQKLAQMPDINPYKTAITTTLATLLRAIMARISVAMENAEKDIIFATPSEWTKGPGTRWPINLEMFITTS